MSEANKNRFKYLICENFDDLSTHQQALSGYDAFLCALGSRVKNGEETFRKVDYQYPINFARLAKQSGVPYYGLCSSIGAKANSWFLYMKVKGEVERDIATIGLAQVDICQPGFILSREGNDFRPMESIFSYIPIGARIEASDLGKGMLVRAI